MRQGIHTVRNFLYLVINDRAKSAYEIAKSWGKQDNDTPFRDSLNKMIKEGDVRQVDGYYELVPQGILSNPLLREKFKSTVSNNKDAFIDVCSDEKYTFLEWVEKLMALQKMLNEQFAPSEIPLITGELIRHFK